MAAGIEQVFFRQRAGRHETDDVALDHCLGAALPRFRRVFHLFADGNAVAHADKLLEIGIRGVHGDPAHRNVLAQVLSALGQRDAESVGCNFCILEEQFIEVAHPEEQEAARIGLLEHQELCHDRSRAAGGLLARSLGHVFHLVHGAFHSRNRPKRYKRRFRKA